MTAPTVRKRFRYRDQSGASLEQHTEHWRNFTWETGPVCVIHKDAAWGVPQVWAKSIEEGKRVIRHAGLIAGINPDEEGSWLVTGTANPRYGREAVVGVKVLRGGYLSVTKRDGPNGLPDVAPLNP